MSVLTVSYRAAVWTAVMLLSGGGWCVANAQAVAIEPRRAHPKADIQVDTHLVMLPVNVVDGKNRPVMGLKPEQFQVFDNYKEQPVVSFSSEDTPLSVGIVLDCSGSMTGQLNLERKAVREFVGDANPEDEFFLVTFSADAELAVPFTTNAGTIEDRLRAANTKGRTALLDAVYLALGEMKQARNSRRVLLLITDGGDNNSRYSEPELRRLVVESNVWIYAFEIRTGGMRIFAEQEPWGGAKLLDDIAEPSGGRRIEVESGSELPKIAAQVAREVRNQYVLAFSPENLAADGKYHRVQVKLAGRRDVHLFWRSGYYAPER